MSEPELVRPTEPKPALPAEPKPVRPAEPEPTLPVEPDIPKPTLPVEPTPALPTERVLPPALEVLNGNEYFKICVPLHNAALEGNWEAAKKIIKKHSQTILGKAIARGGSTVLHVAAGARKRTFVEKLLDSVKQNNDLISKLLLQGDEKGNNAFCFAAATGDVEIAKLMLKKKPGLQNVRGSNYKTPLFLAVLFGQKDMANFLYPRTVQSLSHNELKLLFIESINTDLYDNDGNNILHLAAKYPNPPPAKIVPGAALELQREILMFEVRRKMASAITCKITDVQHFSLKVTCFSKLGAIKVIADKLSDMQLDMFRRSCFGKLFQVNELKFTGQLVHNLLLQQVKYDDSDELWFALPNDSVIRFSLQEFGLITGLDCGPYPKDFSAKDCTTVEPFSCRMFNGSSKVSNKSLDAAFKSASSDNDEDIIKLALLYFLEMVLLGKDPKNHIRREHIQLLDGMNAFNQYLCGRCCYEMTLSGMKKDFKKMAANVGKCIKGHNYEIWACEAIPTIGQHIALKSSKRLPRIVSWSSIVIPKSGEIITLLHCSDLEAHLPLEATAAEEKEDYYKYFVREEDGTAERSFDRVISDGDGNGKNDIADKSGVRAFLKS